MREQIERRERQSKRRQKAIANDNSGAISTSGRWKGMDIWRRRGEGEWIFGGGEEGGGDSYVRVYFKP